MAKVDTNKVVAALRGALGGLVIRQMPDGSVVISTVLDEDRAAVGKGEAVRRDGDWWEYVPSTPWTTATADAWDLAGNKTSWDSPILRV